MCMKTSQVRHLFGQKTRLLANPILFVISLIAVGCQKENPTLDNEQLQISQPASFGTPVVDLAGYSLTKARFRLGKALFYDPVLSRDSTISCGTCHVSFGAFSNPDHATSHGIRNQFGTRNAPAIQNLIWKPEYFWDGGVGTIELIPIAAIQSSVEMDESMPKVTEKVARLPRYQSLTQQAFGHSKATGSEILLALANFMIALVSAESRYDLYVKGDAAAQFSADEVAGLELFRAKCASCHKEPLFTDNRFRNNGLDTTRNTDEGRFLITRRVEDRHKFRVPSLRNVFNTQPYMHDGRFKTLEAVLNHYQSGIYWSSTLDTLVATPWQQNIPLTDPEKKQIIAFLKTLTDANFLKNKEFAEQ